MRPRCDERSPAGQTWGASGDGLSSRHVGKRDTERASAQQGCRTWCRGKRRTPPVQRRCEGACQPAEAGSQEACQLSRRRGARALGAGPPLFVRPDLSTETAVAAAVFLLRWAMRSPGCQVRWRAETFSVRCCRLLKVSPVQ